MVFLLKNASAALALAINVVLSAEVAIKESPRYLASMSNVLYGVDI